MAAPLEPKHVPPFRGLHPKHPYTTTSATCRGPFMPLLRKARLLSDSLPCLCAFPQSITCGSLQIFGTLKLAMKDCSSEAGTGLKFTYSFGNSCPCSEAFH